MMLQDGFWAQLQWMPFKGNPAESPLDKAILFVVAVILVLIVCLLITQIQLGNAFRSRFRLIGFVSLHILNYGANLSTMYIVYTSGHWKYVALLLSAHVTIGIFCMYTAATTINWTSCSDLCPPVLKYAFLVLVMGLMQGVQVKLACDDYSKQRALMNSGDTVLHVPNSMPAKFHSKGMDGILEGTIFAFVAMYGLLKNKWEDFEGEDLTEPQVAMLYFSAFVSFITMGFAMMEVDYRTSAAVQRLLTRSNVAQLRHLIFRSAEVALRLFTVIVFIVFMRPLPGLWWMAFVLVALDYFFGLVLLISLGGTDPLCEAPLLLAIPLFIVNVAQFVDAPGMSLQARRISNVMVPFRIMEVVAVLSFCSLWTPQVQIVGKEEKVGMWIFLWHDHTEWLVAWSLSALLYAFLLLVYAQRMKPEADLHVAVANGDINCLQQLLCGSELVLDINRYGPDGRTPLHLAVVRGQMDCLQLLVEQRANIEARTGDRIRNTALHLAVCNKDPEVLCFLCHLQSSKSSFLNAVNQENETALHLAARRQNVLAVTELLKVPSVNITLKNNKGQTAADCSASDRFGFDRHSNESAITELLHQATAGIRPRNSRASKSSVVYELPVMSTRSSSGARSSGQGPMMGREVSLDVRPAHQDQHIVPLKGISKTSEQEFLRGTKAPVAVETSNTLAVTNCGISSFILSAGLGALSQAFVKSIREDQEANTASDAGEVKASFEDFQEIKKLGEGAFGKVLLVSQKATGELFAMKLMDKAKFKAQKITSKAVSEQYILKTTRHPYIVSLSYAFQGSTFWALVMEYCPNGDLRDLLVRVGVPGIEPLSECARLAGEVLLGLEHLHKIQVIFRDLKLENVVLDANNHAKVTDFGLAKKLYNPQDARTMCGSYGYAAPEIMMSLGQYSYGVDLYSYGVMLYMLLSGGEASPKNPKQRVPPMKHSALRKKLREQERTQPALWAKPEAHAMELLLKLTADDPKERTTATEVKEKSAFFKVNLKEPVDSLLDKADCKP